MEICSSVEPPHCSPKNILESDIPATVHRPDGPSPSARHCWSASRGSGMSRPGLPSGERPGTGGRRHTQVSTIPQGWTSPSPAWRGGRRGGGLRRGWRAATNPLRVPRTARHGGWNDAKGDHGPCGPWSPFISQPTGISRSPRDAADASRGVTPCRRSRRRRRHRNRRSHPNPRRRHRRRCPRCRRRTGRPRRRRRRRPAGRPC